MAFISCLGFLFWSCLPCEKKSVCGAFVYVDKRWDSLQLRFRCILYLHGIFNELLFKWCIFSGLRWDGTIYNVCLHFGYIRVVILYLRLTHRCYIDHLAAFWLELLKKSDTKGQHLFDLFCLHFLYSDWRPLFIFNLFQPRLNSSFRSFLRLEVRLGLNTFLTGYIRIKKKKIQLNFSFHPLFYGWSPLREMPEWVKFSSAVAVHCWPCRLKKRYTCKDKFGSLGKDAVTKQAPMAYKLNKFAFRLF